MRLNTNLVPRRVEIVSDGVTYHVPAPIAFIGIASVILLGALAFFDPMPIRAAILDGRERDVLAWENADRAQLGASVAQIEPSLRALRRESLLRGIAPEGDLAPTPCEGTAAAHFAAHAREAARLSNLLAAQASSQGVAVDRMLPSRAPIDLVASSSPGAVYVSSREGERSDPFTGTEKMHKGLDFAAPPGTPVMATADGHVLFAGIVDANVDHAASLLGNYVEIEHGKTGFRTIYGHLARVDVKTGQDVRLGERIGSVGSTGHSTAPHLHYQVMKGPAAVDPLVYIADVALVREGEAIRFAPDPGADAGTGTAKVRR
jgi:murein DD-endopeptidase MepM/ murein hydrolase activator NlpD